MNTEKDKRFVRNFFITIAVIATCISFLVTGALGFYAYRYVAGMGAKLDKAVEHTHLLEERLSVLEEYDDELTEGAMYLASEVGKSEAKILYLVSEFLSLEERVTECPGRRGTVSEIAPSDLLDVITNPGG